MRSRCWNCSATPLTAAWRGVWDKGVTVLNKMAPNAVQNFDSCTADDKGYSQSKDGSTIYAFALGQPQGQVVFELLESDTGLLNRAISGVHLLGEAESSWQHQPGGLVIDTAGVWKIA